MTDVRTAGRPARPIGVSGSAGRRRCRPVPSGRRAARSREVRRRPVPPRSSPRRASPSTWSPVSATFRRWVTTRQKSSAVPVTVATPARRRPRRRSPTATRRPSGAGDDDVDATGRHVPARAPRRRTVAPARPGGRCAAGVPSAHVRRPSASHTSWPWAHVSISRAEMKESDSHRRPVPGDPGRGSASANASTMARWAPSHQASSSSPPMARPLTRWTSIGSPGGRQDLLDRAGEGFGIDHGHPPGIVEVGEVADLVPDGPSLGGRGQIPPRRRRRPVRPPLAAGRRTRHPGRPADREAWSCARGYGTVRPRRVRAAESPDSSAVRSSQVRSVDTTSISGPTRRSARPTRARRSRARVLPTTAANPSSAPLPLVLVADLGGGDAEPGPARLHQVLDHRPLRLEGVAGGDADVDRRARRRGAPDQHCPTGVTAGPA